MSAYKVKASMFMDRLPASAADLRQGVETAFGIVDNFSSKVTTIRADNMRSSAGQHDEVTRALGKGPLAHLAQLRSNVTRQLKSVRVDRAKCVPSAPDKTDLFAEMQRSELRTYMRNLPDTQRVRFAVESPDAALAIAHAPALLSGLSDEIKSRVVASLVDEKFGARLKEIALIEDGLATADAAMELAEADLRRESGLTEAEFAAAKAAAAKAA